MELDRTMVEGERMSEEAGRGHPVDGFGTGDRERSGCELLVRKIQLRAEISCWRLGSGEACRFVFRRDTESRSPFSWLLLKRLRVVFHRRIGQRERFAEDILSHPFIVASARPMEIQSTRTDAN